MDDIYGETYIWSWYASLCIFSVFNIVVFMKLIHEKSDPNLNSDIKHYQKVMKWCAAPFVFQCAYRSFWPSMYNERIAFFDTPLNSVAIGRGLAHIGEFTWIIQLSYGMIHANEQIHRFNK